MICPILSNMNANGSKRLPLTDLRDSWERYLERPARSIWSLEWLNADETSYFAGERFEDIGADDPMPKDPSAV